MEHVLISDCIIRTRQASPCWWGCGEPINIASINRKDEIPSGRIRDISISNVRCIGEGSVYLAGKESAPLEDLPLKNVHVTLTKTSKYPITGYDFRPTCGPDFEKGKIHGIFLRNCSEPVMQNLKVTIDPSMKDVVDQKICLENTTAQN